MMGAGAARTAARSAAVPMPVPVLTHTRAPASPVRVSSSVPTRPSREVRDVDAREGPLAARRRVAVAGRRVERHRAERRRVRVRGSTAVGLTIATLSMLKSSSRPSSALLSGCGAAVPEIETWTVPLEPAAPVGAGARRSPPAPVPPAAPVASGRLELSAGAGQGEGGQEASSPGSNGRAGSRMERNAKDALATASRPVRRGPSARRSEADSTSSDAS